MQEKCLSPNCPVCEREGGRPYVSFAELEYVECPQCGAVFKSREQEDLRPDDFYEAEYFHGRKSGRDRRFEHRVNKAARQLEVALESVDAESVLDVGCSFGYVIEAGNRLGLRAAGCDISEYAVRVCRERGYRAEVGTLEELPFSAGEFDVVVLKHVLEHTPTPRAALNELGRVTGERGTVVVAVPDLDYWKGRLRRRAYRYFRPDDLGRQHYVYYTQSALCRLLQACGYRITARGKAVFRRKRAHRSLWAAALETLRFSFLYVWQALARVTHMRRELFVVATKEPQSPS